eukprot:TRINITY_DN6256_c0_g1_i1.p1 TRINITY_DN6256_c0_g1~~TRINITY_DN6256_c0_g1_i1.p1  ORF type:complete len:889 (+),score=245.86 TRINITY_DN6256_c0_g1_i1:47-2713(+)
MGGKQSKKMVKKLDEKDLNALKAAYESTVDIPGRGISKARFKSFIDLPDMIGDRVFLAFTFKKNIFIDMEEFVGGMALCHFGSEKDKVGILFSLFDPENTGSANKDSMMKIFAEAIAANAEVMQNIAKDESVSPDVEKLMAMGFGREQCERALKGCNGNMEEAINLLLASSPDQAPSSTAPTRAQVTDNLRAAQASVEIAFHNLEISKDNKISKSRFKKWALSSKRPPEVTLLLVSIGGLYERAIANAGHSAFVTAAPRVARGQSQDHLGFARAAGAGAGTAPAVPVALSVSGTTANASPLMKARSATMSRLPSSPGRPAPVAAKDLFAGSAGDMFEDKAGSHGPTLTNPGQHSPQLLFFDSPKISLRPPVHQVQPSFSLLDMDTPIAGSTGPILTATSPSLPRPRLHTPGKNTLIDASAFSITPPLPSTPTLPSATSAPSLVNTSFTSPTSSTGKPSKTTPNQKQTSTNTSSDGFSSDEDEDGEDGFGYGDGDSSSFQPRFNIVIKERPAAPAEAPIPLPKLNPGMSAPNLHSLVAGGATTMRTRGRRALTGAPASHTSSTSSLGSIGSLEDNRSAPSSPAASVPSSPVMGTPSPMAPADPRTQSLPHPRTTPTTTPNFSSPAITSTPAPFPSPSPSPISTPTPTSPSITPAAAPTGISPQAMSLMKNALAKLEQGAFAEALQEVVLTLQRILAPETGVPPNITTVKGEIIFCTAYKVALGILIETKNLERSQDASVPGRVALLTRFLGDIPLRPNHRMVCMRMAITKNMAARNFGISSRFLEIILSKGVPDQEAVSKKLQLCRAEGGIDYSLPPHGCTKCTASISPALARCTQCNEPVRWCFKTYTLIDQPSYVHCPFCNGVFGHQAGLQPGTQCELCAVGVLEMR